MRRLLWRRIQRNRSPKSLARLSLSSTINYNLITTGAQRSLLTFLPHKIWWFGIQVKKTTTQFQVHVHGKPVHTFQLRILNWKTGNWKVWRNSVFHAPFSVFQFRFATSPVFQTGKLEKLEKCKQCFRLNIGASIGSTARLIFFFLSLVRQSHTLTCRQRHVNLSSVLGIPFHCCIFARY